MPAKKPGAKRGPEAETLKIEGDWEQAVKKALRKPAPRRAKKKPTKRRK